MSKFDCEAYFSNLRTGWLGADLIYKEELESTNSFLKSVDEPNIGHGTVCITDFQTGGRGQYKRDWASDKRKNLTFTIAFKPGSGNRLPLLTLCCALGVARVLDDSGIEHCKIKWPNDLLVDGKKIAGILTESVFVGRSPERVLVGIGLNVNQKTFGDKVGADATSMINELDKSVSREMTLCKILGQIEHLYTRWHHRDTELCKAVNERLIGFGQWVDISINGDMQDMRYKFLGMNDKGECVMLNEGLNVNTFSYEQIRVYPDR
jgi:BirA family biotin operon repressor/biotin-[acetyl-CoA-carboxylase] ligase